jgi:ADP-heptose:LPS heptosyltransferase
MVLLQLTAKPLRGGGINPKNYPYADELKALIKEEIIEIDKPIPLQESKDLINKARKIICIDSYLQHLCWNLGKQAVVLWGQSDPLIFGHSENINLLKHRNYLRNKQFDLWEFTEYNQTRNRPDAFVLPEEIIKYI